MAVVSKNFQFEPDRASAYLQLVRFFVTSTPAVREQIRAEWPMRSAWEYPNSCTLACSGAGPGTCEERILATLVYHAICQTEWRTGSREVLIEFALIWNAASDIGIDAAQLFHDVASLSPPDIATGMRTFADRPPEDKALAAFGYERHATNAGPRYVRIS